MSRSSFLQPLPVSWMGSASSTSCGLQQNAMSQNFYDPYSVLYPGASLGDWARSLPGFEPPSAHAAAAALLSLQSGSAHAQLTEEQAAVLAASHYGNPMEFMQLAQHVSLSATSCPDLTPSPRKGKLWAASEPATTSQAHTHPQTHVSQAMNCLMSTGLYNDPNSFAELGGAFSSTTWPSIPSPPPSGSEHGEPPASDPLTASTVSSCADGLVGPVSTNSPIIPTAPVPNLALSTVSLTSATGPSSPSDTDVKKPTPTPVCGQEVSVLTSKPGPSRSPIHGHSNKANSCDICGKRYARPSTLKTHLRTHSGERPYNCSTCGKAFSQAANLSAHLRTHTGEKPFKCSICDRRFSQSSSVTTHARTHSGERPYKCHICQKAFADTSTLTKHIRVHSGEKPYKCKVCSIGFSQSGNLNRHMRTHNRK